MPSARRKTRLAISAGDPAGIGPEVVRKALADRALWRRAEFVVFEAPYAGKLGKPSVASGRAALANVLNAASAVASGQADALVTAPVSKEALHLAGARYAGHTELLAEFCGLGHSEVGMLLVGGGLRVFLATRHMSLNDALKATKAPALAKAIRLCARGLAQSFGMKRPRLALAALNPHAGEAGAFGSEEKQVLEPLVKRLRRQAGFQLEGPIPADTVFVRALHGHYDAVVCLYHDQGLIPLKLLAFESGVNVTLGLPFVRTSPDHGTAYDIAGSGKADPSSMKAAIELALGLCARRRGL